MKNLKLYFLAFFSLWINSLFAQDCDCVPKDNYQYVEYKSRYRTLKIPVECDSLFSMETINSFLNFGDIYYEVAQDFFGWEFLHPKSLETIVNPSLGGAGTGTGGTGYGMGYFGIELNGFDRDAFAAEYDRNSTIIHEGIHRWDFRGQNYFQGPDIAHPLTVGLQDYLAFKMGMSIYGLYQDQTAGWAGDLEIKRRYKYFWRRYLSYPELDWNYYFNRNQSNEQIYELAPKPEAYERLAIQGGTLLSVYFLHGEPGMQAIFSQIEKLRLEDPTWNQQFDQNKVLERHIKMFGDGLQLDVSDYFDYWKYPVSDDIRNYLSQYPKSTKIQDLDGDGFSPLQGDFDDNDKTTYPDAPELQDGLDNNQDGQVDELVHSEGNGDFPNSGTGTTLSLPTLIQGNLANLSDVDAFSITIPERSYVTVIFTSLNSDTVIQYGDYQIGIFDGVLRRDGGYFMRQDVASGENNLQRTNYWEAGTYVLTVDGIGDRLCPGDYEIQVFVNQQQPVIFEKNGFSYKHHVYNGLEADLNFDVNNVNGVSPAEAAALKTIYEENGGANWENALGWLASEDVCYWRGLSCDRTGLGKINFGNERQLEGPLSESVLSALKNVREFDLVGNNFQNQALADAFGDWKNLSMFRANTNNIRGPLPATLGDKKKLWLIDFRNNRFNGSIPASWSGMSQLKYLDLLGNDISGSLPEDFHRLEKLETFLFDQDQVCVPNQAVWDWLQAIPETGGRDFQRCNQVPSSIRMLTPINQSYDLQTNGSEVINFDWTESQDPENVAIIYTWILANKIMVGTQEIIAPILKIDANSQTALNLTKAALADSLAALGFGNYIKDFFHYAIATDGDWIVSTDTIAIQLDLGAQACQIVGNIEVTAAECFIENTGKAAVQLQKSFGIVTYNWSNGDTKAELETLAPGEYSVRLKDQTGCETELFAFIPRSNLTVDINRQEDLILAEASNGVAPYSYAWHDKKLGSTHSLALDDTYALVIMDAQGCQQLVLSSPILQSVSGKTETSFIAHWKKVPSASGYIVQLAKDPDFKQLVETYEYAQVDQADWLEITNILAGETYYLRVAAYSADALSRFSEPASIQLEQTACDLFIVGNTIDIVRNTTSSGAISVEVFGGNGNYSYQWSDGSSSSNRSNLMDGSYSLTVSDSDNCSASQSFEIQRLERYALGNLIWHDRNRNGIQDPDEPGIPDVKVYIWKDDDRNGSPEEGGFVVTDENGIWRRENLSPGSYLVFVWEIDNFDPGGPLFNMLNSPGSLDTNNDFPTDDNGEPGGINNPLPGGSVASKYIVLEGGAEPLLDGDPFDGLFNQDPSGNMTVDFGFFRKDECPDMTARFSGDLLLCGENNLGDISAVAVNAIGPVRYQWNETNRTPDLKQVGKGTYELLITDNTGCQQNVSVTISNFQDLEIEVLLTNESASGTMDGKIEIINDLPKNLQFNWSNGDTTANLQNVPAGDYQLTVSNAEDCQKTFDFTVSLTTSTQAIFTDFGLRIAPNPSNNFIQLQGIGSNLPLTDLEASLISVDGKVQQILLAKNLDDLNQQLRKTTNLLAPGSYFLRLKSDHKIASQLFIKSN